MCTSYTQKGNKNRGSVLWSSGSGTCPKVVPTAVGNRSLAFSPTRLTKAPAENKTPEGTLYRHEKESCPIPAWDPIALSPVPSSPQRSLHPE